MTAGLTHRNPLTIHRIGVGLVIAAIGLTCIRFSWAFSLLALVIALMSLYELNHLCEVKGQPLVYPIAILGVAGYVLLAAFGLMHRWEGVLLAVIVLAAFWLGMYGEQKGYFARTAYTLLAVLYIGKLVTYFIFIRAIPQTGMIWTYYVVVLIALTDILGMVVGTFLGRIQLTKISPKKTLEGSLGALLLVTACASAATFLPALHLQWWQGAIIGATTSVAAQAGDIVESALKRDAGVKDAGSAIVGHGGVLDRFDSYLFGGVAFFATLHVLAILRVQ